MQLPSRSSRMFLDQATVAYQEQGSRSATLSDYLSSRGISADVSEQFSLGLCSDPLPGHERFRGAVSIPYLTPTGVVGMKFRMLDGGDKKYDAPAGQEHRLFNVAALWSRHIGYVIVCEGEFDTIVTAGVCGLNAVGINGTNGWKEWFPLCLEGFRNVFILMDNDDDKPDGINYGQDAAKKISMSMPDARILRLPISGDVNEFVLERGPDALRSMIESAL